MNLHTLYLLPDHGTPLFFLAPMADYTDAAMRRVCHRAGASLTYTEMVNAYSCARMDAKTWSLLETLSGEGPAVAQLYGNDPEVMAAAARAIEASGRFVGIDVNAGCPVHKITCCGAGSALMKDPQRIHDILAAMVCCLHLPVSLKTRIGPTPDKVSIFEILAAAESAGASAVTVHGRFTSQGHGGDPRLDILAEVKSRARIPVIGNGGIRSPHDARRMIRETGVDAVMIGRGAIGAPWIFSDLQEMVALQEDPPAADGRCRRSLDEVRTALRDHMEGTLELIRRRLSSSAAPPEKGEEFFLALAFRNHLFRYLSGMAGSSHVRANLSRLHTVQDIREAVETCFMKESALRLS